MSTKRTKHTPEFKAKIALAALREQETIAEIARRYKVHANMVYKWRQILLDNLPCAFTQEPTDPSLTSQREAELLQKIGELKVRAGTSGSGSAAQPKTRPVNPTSPASSR